MRAAGLALLLAAASGCAAHDAPRAEPARPDAAVRRLQADLTRVFGAPLTASAAWGVEVRSLDRGETLFAWRREALMMPASNMKVVTLAVAAETLGWEHRFTTSLHAAGEVAGGVLTGDLVVRGDGDPSFNRREGRAARVLDEWAEGLKAAGVTRVTGRLIADDRAFEDEWLGAGWAWDYLQYGYAAPSGALQYNDSTAELAVAPGRATGDPALARLTEGSGLTILNRAATGEPGSAFTMEYRRHVHQPVLEITGSIPAGSVAVTRTVAVVNPTLFFATALKTGLAARGVSIDGEAADVGDLAPELRPAGPLRPLVTTRSPTLRELAAVLMKASQNQYAEMLLKAAGAAGGGPGSSAAGREAARRVLLGWGIPDGAYMIADGSGLSRYNYLSASMLAAVLERMYRDERHRDAFLEALPVAGREGTLAGRLKRTRAEGNASAKTGSISNVRALSGYLKTRDGETVVFSILVNHFLIPAATANWITDLAVEILANFTRR